MLSNNNNNDDYDCYVSSPFRHYSINHSIMIIARSQPPRTITIVKIEEEV